MECEKCKSNRILEISAKCSDLCCLTFKGVERNDDVPCDLKIGGGDYIEVDICLDCGMAQRCGNTEDPQFYTDRDDIFDQDILTDRKCPECEELIVSHSDCTLSCSNDKCDFVEI